MKTSSKEQGFGASFSQPTNPRTKWVWGKLEIKGASSHILALFFSKNPHKKSDLRRTNF
jgi:hypothetical protein